MIVQRIEIVSYDKERNTCKARLQNSDLIELDPFVSCAIRQTDEDYEANRGTELIGKKFLLTLYSVYSDSVVPHEGRMIAAERVIGVSRRK